MGIFDNTLGIQGRKVQGSVSPCSQGHINIINILINAKSKNIKYLELGMAEYLYISFLSCTGNIEDSQDHILLCEGLIRNSNKFTYLPYLLY